MKRRLLIAVTGILLIMIIVAPSVVLAAPGVYNTVEGNYFGKAKIPLYYTNNVLYLKIRYANIVVNTQTNAVISDATVYLYEYATDLSPVSEIDCTGIVGDDNRPLFILSGIDGVTGDSVMIKGQFCFNRYGNVYAMKGTILLSLPGADPVNNSVGRSTFKIPWHPNP